MTLQLPRMSNSGPIVFPSGPQTGHPSFSFTGWWNTICDAIEGAINSLQTQQAAITANATAASKAATMATAAQNTANTALTQVNGVIPVINGGTGDSTLTAHGVLVGEGTSPVHVTAIGAANNFLAGVTGADPIFRTFVAASADLANQGAVTTVLHGNAAGNPSWGAVSLTADVSGTLPVANGGTGDATLTAHGVLIGEGTSAIVATAAGGAFSILAGNGAADPTFQTLSAVIDGAIGSTRGAILYRGAAGWAILAPGAAGTKLTSNGAGTDPTWT